MKMFNKIKGDIGEEKAVKYLKKQGYKIITRNYNCGFAEIDIVATKKRFIIAVEVKARTTDEFGMPFQAVDERKQRKIQSALEWFVQRNPKYKEYDFQFDIVSILGDELEHIENAF